MGSKKASRKVPGVNAIVEILAEEIPARFLSGILKDYQQKMAERLESAEVPFQKIQTYGTARRLVLVVEGLPEKQRDRRLVKRGPPVDLAYSPDGIPSLAAVGFAKTAGVRVTQLVKRREGNREYVFAEIRTPGKTMKNLLSTMLPEVIGKIELPITMRWGSGENKFIRPIHAILALCGGDVIPFTFAGIRSGNFTFPHRMLPQKKIVFGPGPKMTWAIYRQKLRRFGIVVDPEERKKQILRSALQLAQKRRARPNWSDALLSELVFTLENPVPGLGNIREAFLTLPKPVLETVLRKQQQYVPLENREGELLSTFIFWSDGRRAGASLIREGNERVIDARLSDARFFFDEDKKHPLADRHELLRHVAFFGNLGSMADKVDRVEKLSAWLCDLWKFSPPERETALRVAKLSKSDLTTEMVKEFPELQGIMGREYARQFGETEDVAEGIAEHYLPRSGDDPLPKTKGGMVVSVAEKLDTLVGAFGVGLSPTGSEDPYGLRRQAIGMVNLVVDRQLSLPISTAVEFVFGLYRQMPQGGIAKSSKEIQRELWNFLQIRLRSLMEERNLRYDVINAALPSSDDLLSVVVRGSALMKVIESEWFRGVILTADRVTRLAAKASRGDVHEPEFVESAERALYTSVLDVSERIQGALRVQDFERAIHELSRLTLPVGEFFEKVLVMHENESLRANRLALLKTLATLFRSVADFQQIVVQKETLETLVKDSAKV